MEGTKSPGSEGECRDWLLIGAVGAVFQGFLCDLGTYIKYLSLFGRRECYISSLLERKVKIRNKKVNQNPDLLCKVFLSSSCGGCFKGLDDAEEALAGDGGVMLTIRLFQLPQAKLQKLVGM